MPAEIVEDAAHVSAVTGLLVEILRALAIRARHEPLPLALGDRGCTEVDVGRRDRVAQPVDQLQGALDVTARCAEVALTLVAAGAPAATWHEGDRN